MHDTDNNVIDFQARNDLHRYHTANQRYAYAIERHERVTLTDIAIMVLAYLVGAGVMAACLSVLWLCVQFAYAWIAENGLFGVLAVLGVAL